MAVHGFGIAPHDGTALSGFCLSKLVALGWTAASGLAPTNAKWR